MFPLGKTLNRKQIHSREKREFVVQDGFLLHHSLVVIILRPWVVVLKGSGEAWSVETLVLEGRKLDSHCRP